ncbi:hypothetical protein E2542_SST30051 [Spatholobus suberectus]|nr:hypothetical protein E2542_SST30051 [Spatholobus suberectus]
MCSGAKHLSANGWSSVFRKGYSVDFWGSTSSMMVTGLKTITTTGAHHMAGVLITSNSTMGSLLSSERRVTLECNLSLNAFGQQYPVFLETCTQTGLPIVTF